MEKIFLARNKLKLEKTKKYERPFIKLYIIMVLRNKIKRENFIYNYN
jgi:hypothetical protein